MNDSSMGPPSRRAFVKRGVLLGATILSSELSGRVVQECRAERRDRSQTFDLIRAPDHVMVFDGGGSFELHLNGNSWVADKVSVVTEPIRDGTAEELPIWVSAP